MAIRNPRPRVRCDRHGTAAVLAMLFLVLLSTLAVAMISLAGTNLQTASNLSDVTRAQAAAESGLRWTAWRFVRMDRPKTTIGKITPSVADSLWPALRSAIVADFATLLDPAERPVTTTTTSVTSSPIAIDDSGARFGIQVRQHPLDPDDPLDQRWLRVTSTGTYRDATRSLSMDFRIDKKVKFALVGKVPIQLGRNTLVEGPVAMATANKYPPLFMLSDFTHFHAGLATKVSNWHAWLEARHAGYDGRVSVNNKTEYNAARSAGYNDYNSDAYIDEWDLFVKQFDNNGDKAVSQSEFTNPSTGKLYDPNLFAAIDSLGAPLFDGDPVRLGYLDGLLDNADGYMKIRGRIALATDASGWTSNLASQGKTINDMIVGPIASGEPLQPPIKFAANTSDIFDLSPANFEGCCDNFRNRSGTFAGASSFSSGVIANAVLTASRANGGTATERTPYGSTSYQATYKRPVFRNMTLRNVTIPKGLNALFDNCTFEGVTFVDMERNITTSTGQTTFNKDDGKGWAERRLSGDSFSKDKVLLSSGSPSRGQTITHGSQKGNNIRFNNCTFQGPIAGGYSTAYTHFSNSWEFTGSTLFENQVDDTATIVCPNTNIEMGSFTDPTRAPSTLVGVVVAGNLDIRGTSTVDGSIIITGDGAGNTTLAFFGASDDQTNPGALPEGGYGRLNIRYNPHRALPDGIDLAIDILPDVSTYREGP